MNKKAGQFLEEHIEKIVLAIIALISLWLLIVFVIISPNKVDYDGKKFSPGEIDGHINKQVKRLEDKLNQPPQKERVYQPYLDDLNASLDSILSDIDVTLYLPQPNRSLMDLTRHRKYSLPEIGQVTDVHSDHIRAVAYVPVEQINENNPYEETKNEPNDIDLVTVEAKFDVAKLYEMFYENFAGEVVKEEEWRDTKLANPVFAAVQLQRQQQISNDGWSDWKDVSRAKIDHRRGMFEIIENSKQLPPGGIKVRLLQFDDPEVRIGLLQPEAYRIASPKEEWFPPSLHKEFVRLQQNLVALEKREAMKAEKEKRERERTTSRPERRRSVGTRSRPGRGDDDESSQREDSGSSLLGRKARERTVEKELVEKSRELEETTNKIYEEYENILITRESSFARMDKPLQFWAFDDTVKPGNKYRYRIRLGVFNPIAGTNQFDDKHKHLKNNVILWSDFSDITNAVEIPGTLYFFPRDIQETTKTVTIQVSKYVLGYWYNHDFAVRQGEAIGKVAKPEIKEEKHSVIVPEMIDYDTGAVLVDVVPVNDWSGGKTLRARHYFDMLYSFDGTDIRHVPVKSRYWPEKLQTKFNEIKKSEKEPKQPLRPWEGRRGRRLVPVRERDDELLRVLED